MSAMLLLLWWMVTAIGAGMSQAHLRRFRLKGKNPPFNNFEATFSMLRDQIPNFPKDGDLNFMSSFRNHRKASASPFPGVPPPPTDCSAHFAELLSSSLQIGDLSFSVDTPVGERRVRVDCGDLRGLDDFDRVPPTSVDDRRGLSGKCLFSWSRLRATCGIETSLDGLRDRLGETEVRFDSLFVEVIKEGPEVNVVPVGMRLFSWLEEDNVRNLSQDEKEDIQRELSSRIQGSVNSQVANLLKQLVREGLRNSNVDLVCQCVTGE